MTPGFEVIRGGMGGMTGLGNPFMGLPPSAAGMLGALGFPPMGYPNLMGSGLNTAQFLQQGKFKSNKYFVIIICTFEYILHKLSDLFTCWETQSCLCLVFTLS